MSTSSLAIKHIDVSLCARALGPRTRGAGRGLGHIDARLCTEGAGPRAWERGGARKDRVAVWAPKKRGTQDGPPSLIAIDEVEKALASATLDLRICWKCKRAVVFRGIF